MKAKLYFEEQEMLAARLGEANTTPDLTGGIIIQNDLEFHLSEEDEIFEGYGKRRNSYPYPQYASYTRKLEKMQVQTAVLENDYLKAVFLPQQGGRLWSLIDKTTGKNLLYTNDVLQYSNLAVRNAWFSGGVEWNISVIGHTPFTTEPLFTAVLEKEDGTPVLRMYEYERIRQVTYQMDFWLEEEDRFLNARMRIVNTGEEVVPMYWWSNMAVPEYENGRIVVPAEEAYTTRPDGIYKVSVPYVDGLDISKYKNIPSSVDYFFDIPKEDPKYILNVDENGYGLCQFSTSRLRSRKLFSWGKKPAGDHWQEFLTKDAGRYVEIQAGLGKTQYGCIPMAPHTAWEWMERYGAVSLGKEAMELEFEQLRQKVTGQILNEPAYQEIETVLRQTKELAKKPAKVQQRGSSYGALAKEVRAYMGKRPLPEHLDFGTCGEDERVWAEFLKTGVLAEPDVQEAPGLFLNEDVFGEKLRETVAGQNQVSWFAHYHLGLFYFERDHYGLAAKEFSTSLAYRENAWAYHGLASAQLLLAKPKEAAKAIRAGMAMRNQDVSYLKEGYRLLTLCEDFETIVRLYEEAGEEVCSDTRIRFYYILALHRTGKTKEAFDLLCADGGLVIDDIREGEIAVGDLWQEMHRKIYGEEGELPYIFDFIAVE